MRPDSIDWHWIATNGPLFRSETWAHVQLALIPVGIGLACSLPLGVFCARFRRLAPLVLGTTTILYALPSLALFAILIDFTGLSQATVIIPLTIYSLAVLVRGVFDGLSSVPDPVRQAATAMGYGQTRRLVAVELPMALPVVVAALRVATVSSISLVSVGSLIGQAGLGQLFLDGFQTFFNTEVYAGIALTLILAFGCDAILAFAGRLLTPWTRAAKAA